VTDASVLEYFKELRNKELPLSRETLMSKEKKSARNSNILFKTSSGWCEGFMEKRRKLIKNFLWN
jgi:hypothetical protein